MNKRGKVLATAFGGGLLLAFAGMASASETETKTGKVKSRRTAVKSPLAGVSDEAWRKFTVAMMDTSNHISSTYHLGVFHFAFPTLSMIGMAQNAHRGDYNGKTVWLGEFIPPLTMEAFLGSLKPQYDAFAKLAKYYVDRVKAYVGTDIDGRRATLSGLIAVGFRAGPKGFKSWIDSEGDRKKFPNTTGAFLKANGIF